MSQNDRPLDSSDRLPRSLAYTPYTGLIHE
jgi:hypothetical protein